MQGASYTWVFQKYSAAGVVVFRGRVLLFFKITGVQYKSFDWEDILLLPIYSDILSGSGIDQVLQNSHRCL